MKAIVAVDKNWGIGKNNKLLFSLPLDMAFFRNTTKNKVVVMGKKTLLSFPNGNPLKNRTNIVLSSSLNNVDGAIIVKSMAQLFETLKDYNTDDVFIIGGASVYKAMLPFVDEVYVTKVFADGCADTFFENLDIDANFDCVYKSEIQETNQINIMFTTYKNKCVKELL